MAMLRALAVLCQWLVLVSARMPHSRFHAPRVSHGGGRGGFSFFGMKMPSFRNFQIPGFPKSGKGSPLNFFSDKNSAKFGSIPGLPGSAQKRGSSSDMLGTMCGMMSLPFVCDSTSQGINSAECKKSPAACCGRQVQHCSDTDPFTFSSPCGAVDQGAKCVGSVMTSFNKVGVCMCPRGTSCQGAGTGAKCSAGSLSLFSEMYEEEDQIEAEAELNISGWLVLATLFTCFSLSISLVARGVRWLRQPGQNAPAHHEHSQLPSEDAEAELLD